ncbi:DUF6377 domain-containing protein [Limibacter armeniacum]|uniref:DUF6377 domain-containing protein n=1 Tax=Limibacter armeniacum TaxID=466084 RepID=UPI002FE5A461
MSWRLGLVHIFGFLCLFSFAQAESGIEQLDEILSKKEFYEQQKLERIKKLKRQLSVNQGASLRAKFDLNNKLYQEYKSFVFDSAFQYSNRLIDISYQLNDESLIGYAKINLGFTLLSSGMFKEAFDTLNSVQVNALPDTTKIDYYALMARMLYDISDYNQDQHYSPEYIKKADVYVDFATNLADPDSYHYLYLTGLRDLREGRTDDAIRILNRLLESNPNLGGQKFAITAATLSFLYLKMDDTAKAIALLEQASVSDIKHAIKETSAMTSLAQLLYKTGDIEKAYEYINESMEDAKYYGAKQRMSEVGKIFPVISSSKLNSEEARSRDLLHFSIIVGVLTLIILCFAIITVFQKRRISQREVTIKENNSMLRKTNEQLFEANTIKDEYLGFYLELPFQYLGKLDHIKDSIETKLTGPQYKEIRYILSKVDQVKEKQKLLQNFDKSFIKIFPNFIEQFNQLFDEDHQFVPHKDEILCTEIRLFALIRIGIKDSDRLANILGYSVNTIYAYKNRIKNQSYIPNNEFEAHVMEINAN